MNWLKAFFARIVGIFSSPGARAALDKIADLVPHALPVIKIAGDIVTTLTPSGADDAAWAAIQRMFPALFDGSLKTGEEVKLYALAIATELLKRQFSDVTTSEARAAVQVAYTAEVA